MNLNLFFVVAAILIFCVISIIIIFLNNKYKIITRIEDSKISLADILLILEKKLSLPTDEMPIAAQVGDLKNLKTIEELKQENEVDAEIYKDAQDGDYVFGYANRMIIYRYDEDKIIYDGKTARKKMEEFSEEIATEIVKKAKLEKLIPPDYTLLPYLTVVTDAEEVITNNPDYVGVIENDIFAAFSSLEFMLIYRRTNKTIVYSGKFDNSLPPKE